VIVTSFVLQSQNRSTHSLQKYLRNFRFLENTGLDIMLYWDRGLLSVADFRPNVKVIPVSLEEFYPWSLWSRNHILPATNNPAKDTIDYMMIMNSKTFLMEKSITPGDDRYTWVDFGLGHVFKDPESTFKHLADLHRLPPGVSAPSGAGPSDHLDRISWRFLGGFISFDTPSLRTWNQTLRRELEECWPQASWEVNYWARIESKCGLPTNLYPADHDDSMLRFI